MSEIDDIIRDIEALEWAEPHVRQQRLTRIRLACEALPGTAVQPDKGPWTASTDGRHISSDNFDHDVMLKVSGDFYSDQARAAYSNAICNQLNGAKPLPTGLPTEPPAGLLWSMAMRLRHDFGIDAEPGQVLSSGFTSQEREALLVDMRRLYNEVAGHGFYKWQDVTEV
jgi:hypothetical protein